MFGSAVSTDDSGSDKPGPSAADGTESELSTDDLSEKLGKIPAGIFFYAKCTGFGYINTEHDFRLELYTFRQ